MESQSLDAGFIARVVDAANEFVRVADQCADRTILILLHDWLKNDTLGKFDSETRSKMMLNVMASINLVQTIQYSYLHEFGPFPSESLSDEERLLGTLGIQFESEEQDEDEA